MLLTIGYQGCTAAELVRALLEARTDVLVDVRLTPSSRKAGLSKSRLAATLEAAGIEYLHMPELGNPRDNREPFRRGDPQARARFEAQLRTPNARAALEQLGSRAQAERFALLCFERDPETCHRQIVSEYLFRQDPRLEIQHL